jgi:HD-like signal output (HDOD) protein
LGKIAMAAVFPAQFSEIQTRHASEPGDLLGIEVDVLGMNHAEIGALYLEYHNLPEALIEAVRFHHQPELAPQNPELVAAVQLADALTRHSNIGNSGNRGEVTFENWVELSGWAILYPHHASDELGFTRDNLTRNLEHLPAVIEGIV